MKGLLLSELIELLLLRKEQIGDIPVHIMAHDSVYPLTPGNLKGEIIKAGECEWNDWDMYILLET